MEMEWFEIGGMMIGLVVGLMALGIPVAFAFLLSNIVGAFLFMGGLAGVEQLINNCTRSVSSFLLVPVPLFILMGEIFFHTGLSQQIFSTLDKLFGRLQGRLSYMAVVGGTIFAALSGSSISTTAMMGTSMVPEMTSRGYKKHMAMGPILGSGSLAILIPPSALVVLLGSLAFIDIGALLIGGILPGLCLAILYTITIYILIKIDPSAAPQYDVDEITLLEKIKLTTIYILPLGLVFFLVVGFIVLGIATPSESAAFGVLGVFILAVLFKCMSWSALRKALEGTLVVTVMVLMILLASSTFSQMMLTIPLFLPLAKSLGCDPVWFGIIIILALEISTVTPPFGLLLFVMMGVAPPNTTFGEVVVAGLPYILCAFVMLGLLVAFPEIVLFLPSL